MPRQSITDRFLKYVAVDPDTGCWNWTGGKRDGYGVFQTDGNARAAHRVSFKLFVREIASEEHIHHLCHNRACVCVEHLVVIALHDHNLLHHPKATHCERGHALTPDNLSPAFLRQGRKRCQICMREAQRDYRKRRPRIRTDESRRRESEKCRKAYAESETNGPDCRNRYSEKQRRYRAKKKAEALKNASAQSESPGGPCRHQPPT